MLVGIGSACSSNGFLKYRGSALQRESFFIRHCFVVAFSLDESELFDVIDCKYGDCRDANFVLNI